MYQLTVIVPDRNGNLKCKPILRRWFNDSSVTMSAQYFGRSWNLLLWQVEHRTDSLKGYSGYNGNVIEDLCLNGVQSYCHTRLANPAPATLLHNPKGIFCELAFRSSSPVGPRLRQMWWTIEQPKDWFNYLNVSFEQSNNDIRSSTNRQFEIQEQFSISLPFVRN